MKTKKIFGFILNSTRGEYKMYAAPSRGNERRRPELGCRVLGPY